MIAESKILEIENPIECRIVDRINRFVLRVELRGDYHRAYTCARYGGAEATVEGSHV